MAQTIKTAFFWPLGAAQHVKAATLPEYVNMLPTLRL